MALVFLPTTFKNVCNKKVFSPNESEFHHYPGNGLCCVSVVPSCGWLQYQFTPQSRSVLSCMVVHLNPSENDAYQQSTGMIKKNDDEVGSFRDMNLCCIHIKGVPFNFLGSLL